MNVKSLHRAEDGSFQYLSEQGEVLTYEERFSPEMWDCSEAFKFAGIRGYEPMTAKELETEEEQDKVLEDSSYVVEEKFDGTRALVYFFSQQVYDPERNTLTDEYTGYCRVFSRRISKKTGFYVENTDSVPQIREIDCPKLGGTILDGEMFINGLPFKEVSSVLNCLWDRAIDRQIEKGFVTFHAFDILFYKGVDMRRFPLERRKKFLQTILAECDSPYIEGVDCYECGNLLGGGSINGHQLAVDVYSEVMKRVKDRDEDVYFDSLEEDKDKYPHLYECWKNDSPLTPRAYYELIVSTGGEGVMVKPKDGKYLHKRGWEYSKVKAFLTRDLIITGFDEPTREYTGKDRTTWGFWEEVSTGKKVKGNFYGKAGYEPITKFYFNSQVGNLMLGVLITREELDSIPEKKRGEFEPYDKNTYIMHVCECGGFDDDTRDYFTRNRKRLIHKVVEVKANGLFKDTGKMRHPRFMRLRPDKNLEQCKWIDHIGG